MTSECRIPLISIAACAAALALPSLASANDYCVDTACDGTQVDSIEQAFDLADDNMNADRVILGPKVYTPTTPSGWGYNGGGPMEIVGAGRGRTILTAPASTMCVVCLVGGDGTSIRDLTIRLSAYVQQGTVALKTVNDAKRVEVTEDFKQNKDHIGVVLWSGATLEHSSVDAGGYGTGIELYAGGATIRDTTVRGSVGIRSVLGNVTIERTRVTASDVGLQAERKATTIRDSVIQLTGYTNGEGAGIRADTQTSSGSDVRVDADGVTIAAPLGSKYGGVTASTFNAPAYNAEIDLANSVIRGTGTPLGAYATGMAGATVKASYSDYPAGSTKLGVNAFLVESNVSDVGDAGFADAANGDFHLLPTSKLLDQGDPAAAPGLDLDGNPLVADGNADGTARRDLGAYELQPPAPAGGGGGEPGGGQPAADTVAPVISRFTARGARVRYSLSETARVTLRIKRVRHGRHRTIATLTRSGRAGANLLRLSRRIAARTKLPGRYRVVIRAIDPAGNRSAARAIRLRVAKG